MQRILLLLILLLGLAWPCLGQKVSISLFDDLALEQVGLKVIGGGYRLLLDGLFYPLTDGQLLTLRRDGDQVQLLMAGAPTIRHGHLVLLCDDSRSSLELTPLLPTAAEPRRYSGNLSLYVDFHRLMCINLVDLSVYIGCVAHAELGHGAPFEAYRAQAILVRTYLYDHLNRHIEEGFNLCDAVHCQAYLGLRNGVEEAIRAARETQDLVLISATTGELVPAFFHANCGGESASAGDVWLQESPHLQRVVDPHCRASRGAHWTQQLPLAEWNRFLESKGVRTAQLRPQDYAFASDRRLTHYKVAGKSIPFRDLREYFNLKSGFFTVRVQGQRVHLRGRGYGHGSGLCQEGAIAQARKGRRAEQILAFYFKDVRIVPYSQTVLPAGQ